MDSSWRIYGWCRVEVVEDEAHETGNDGFEMDADEHDDEDDHGVLELIGDLYRAAEADGK